MTTGARLAAFGIGLVAVFGTAAGVGVVAGPIDVGGRDDHHEEPAASTPPTAHDDHEEQGR